MAFTSHGHHITGSIVGDERPASVARCGGPGLCIKCSQETAAFFLNLAKGYTNMDKIEQTDERPIEHAKALAVLHANKRTDLDHEKITVDQLEVVWFSYILGNWKALLTAPLLKDGMYYEVTRNNGKQETYVDSYKKWENSAYTDNPETPEEKTEA